MNKFRSRKTNEKAMAETYHFYSRMKGSDQENLKKAIGKLSKELGMVPSNPMLLSYLLRKYVQ